jgi:hypothetical protein
MAQRHQSQKNILMSSRSAFFLSYLHFYISHVCDLPPYVTLRLF